MRERPFTYSLVSRLGGWGVVRRKEIYLGCVTKYSRGGQS